MSMLRNGEINWVVTGTTFSLSILAFLLYCLLVWKSKRKGIESKGAVVKENIFNFQVTKTSINQKNGV